jgi:DNA polymerase-3 subunit delta
MYKKDFEQLLHVKKVPSSIFFYGDCDFQNNYFAEKTLRYWNANEDEKLLLHYDDYNFTTAKNHLSQSSLFGGNNILIIKTDKVIPAKELDVLVSLAKKSSESFFIYQYFGDGTKAKKLSSSFAKKNDGDFVRFFKPNMPEAISLLSQKAKESGLAIQGYALSHLYLLHSEDLSLCVNEFNKLSILQREITTSDIDKLVYGLGTVGLDQFIAKLLKKEDIKNSFSNLCESGINDEIRVVNAIQNYLSNLLLFHMYIKMYGTFDARAILGYPLPPQLAKQRADESIKIELKTYKELYQHLLETELKLKKLKDLDKNTYLLSSLIKLQKIL